MGKRAEVMYTLTQHSGFAYGGDRQFERGVELEQVSTKRDQTRVLNAGGTLYAHYIDASDAEESENYPPEVEGLTPKVKGSFSPTMIEGKRIYLPHNLYRKK